MSDKKPGKTHLPGLIFFKYHLIKTSLFAIKHLLKP